MSEWGKSWWAAWAWALLFWSLVGTNQLAWGQALPPVLARRVAPTPGRRPLGAVLAELSRQSGVSFSYSSSLVPLAARCQVHPGPPRPLSAVLREVLATQHLAYGLLDGQLVLWPDRLAVPAGVVAVNGYAAPSAQPLARPAASKHGPVAAQVEAQDARAAGAARLPGPMAAKVNAGVRPSASPATPNAISSASPPALQPNFGRHPSRKAALTSRAKPLSGEAPRAGFSRQSPAAAPARPAQQVGRQWPLAADTAQKKRPAGRSSTTSAYPSARQRLPPGSVRPAAVGSPDARASANNSGRQDLASRPLQVGRSVQRGRLNTRSFARPRPLLTPADAPAQAGAASLAELPARPVQLAAASRADTASRPSSVLLPVAAGSPETKPPQKTGNMPRRFYLHGEAWGSESLPLNAALKLGLPRIYLLLGATIGPPGHGDPAAGIGLGTAGTARGRFTPSLDVLWWFLGGDRDNDVAHASLVQVRPALAWQLRPAGRLQLFGGPTLNLATARHTGPRRWDFGQNQWLWLNDADAQGASRLWPGVQLGLRF